MPAHANDIPHCPECSAPQVDGLDCWGMLGGIIAWESGNAELFGVHFLTVASYNLQHPAMYHDEAIAGLRETFIEVVENDLPIDAIRCRVSAVYNGSKQVRRPEAERHPVLRAWSMTIADVYLPDRPEGAAERVRAWAKAIRSEL